jgi:hypothetical protein
MLKCLDVCLDVCLDDCPGAILKSSHYSTSSLLPISCVWGYACSEEAAILAGPQCIHGLWLLLAAGCPRGDHEVARL